MSAHGVIRSSTTSARDREHRLRTFLRHVLEMIIAMMLGMCILGMAFRGIHTAIFGGGFDAAWRQHTELAVFAMTFNMTLPMVRGCITAATPGSAAARWQAAMFVLPRAGSCRSGWRDLSGGCASVGDGADAPAMIAVMALRFDEYATHAPAHSRGSTPRLAGS